MNSFENGLHLVIHIYGSLYSLGHCLLIVEGYKIYRKLISFDPREFNYKQRFNGNSEVSTGNLY